MTVTIKTHNDALLIQFPYNELDQIKARDLPQRRWNSKVSGWIVRSTLQNVEYIDLNWPRAVWSEPAQIMRNDAYERQEKRDAILKAKSNGVDFSALDGVPFKMPPMEHQKTALLLGRDLPAFAYLMDQGTGKTKTLLDDAAHNWRQGRIDAVLILTINSVKSNWVIWDCDKDHEDDKDAVDTHMAPDIPYVKGVWISQTRREQDKYWDKFVDAVSTEKNKLFVLAANIDALNVPRALSFFQSFCRMFKTMIVVDESTIIGTPGAKRTKIAHKLRAECPVARIMSGTPIVKSPLKAYSQFKFLDEDILGFGSFFTFKNHYCTLGGFKNKQVMGFKHLDELQEKIQSVSYRVLKEQCLDLPPKVYEKRRVSMTGAQLKAYKDMQQDLLTWHEKTGTVAAPIILTQLLRLQQITGGYLPKIDDMTEETLEVVPLVEPKNNPKFNEVLQILEESGDQRVMIWTRFTKEIEDLYAFLTSQGYNMRTFYGALSDKEKIAVRKDFARDKSIKGVIGNQAAGGLGIDEFKAASIVIYLSNSFDTEKRIQSEDRTHRIGSEIHNQITYFDLVVPNTIDMKIIQVMRQNVNISDQIMQDGLREWI